MQGITAGMTGRSPNGFFRRRLSGHLPCRLVRFSEYPFGSAQLPAEGALLEGTRPMLDRYPPTEPEEIVSPDPVPPSPPDLDIEEREDHRWECQDISWIQSGS